MKIRRKKSYCFNCNTSLSKEDNFCRKCGQENHEKKTSLKNLIDDFLGDYLTFDSKIWKSLKLLCFSPGTLTLLYSEGKITEYIRPIRLMLFLSLLYVISLSLYLDHSKQLIRNSGIHVGDSESALESYQYILKNYESIDDYIEKEKKNESFLNKSLMKGIYNLVGGGKNVFNEALKKTSTLLFVLLPILGLVFKFTFWRNNLFYVEHFVHALHIYSFFFLIATVGMLLSWLFSISIIVFAIAFITFYIYLFLSYKTMYNRSRLISFVKLTTTSFIFYLLISVGFLVSLIITISIS